MRGSTVQVARRITVGLLMAFTAVFFIYLCAITFFEQRQRLYSRTVSERQFHIGGQPWELDLAAIREFEKQHALNPEGAGGVRFSIEQWPRWKYVISLELSPNRRAKGALHAIDFDGRGPAYEREFELGAAETRRFVSLFDEQIDGYRGGTSSCVDGTSFQFERWKDRRVLSGRGNAACDRHYAELMSLIAETLVVKLDRVPFDWRAWFAAKGQLALNGNGS